LHAAANEHPECTIKGDATKFEPATESQEQRVARWSTRAGCSAGRTNLGIAPNGRAVLCEQMPLIEPYFVGDLAKQSISEVWNSDELATFVYPPQERFVGTACFTCEDFAYCVHELGYCFRDALFAFNRLHAPPPTCPRIDSSPEPPNDTTL
jgi:radical SAM protein with 4Fe4S-binding SPASM domain